ncbi:uncharacterized protein BT62DRAFT_987040 [Guyanagaster necrorhizus]|uniref:Uncharacterized protein n=1 Tax=Guyanagaster necrorhizus TaxID=856835 RepID=A0A9P7VVH3_9AGAR|nr:uncharacterized protein BT62DRAFT_987040 [Guyanagaster necrorhizus MCA 3950]KAG7446636.1 hypothetical protein BT62DRAFT_987040 [Guyanagaster necrorhizus MCA 3950]
MTTRTMSPTDCNPRPTKRQRRDSTSNVSPAVDGNYPSPLKATAMVPTPSCLTPLPPSLLLVSLPGILIHPPTHRHHAQSLCLSLLALRRCLNLSNLTPEVECRAWTAMVEIGMLVIAGGFSQNEDHLWAKGIEIEVEKAANKALNIAQKHPTLRLYRPHVTCLTARLLHWQHKSKFSLTLLRRLLNSFLPSDPPHTIYAVHLTLISHLTTSNSSSSISRPKETQAPLSAIQALADLADKNRHSGVKLYALVLRLRTLVSSNLWESVDNALRSAEEALGIDCPSGEGSTVAEKQVLNSISNTPRSQEGPIAGSPKQPSTPTPPMPKFVDKLAEIMAIHTLMIGVVFHTFVGNFARASMRLTLLHMLMDSGVLITSGSGVVEITFPNPPSPPLLIQTTHPRVLLILAYLISAISRKDPVGRKPKRKTFAVEGLAVWEKEMRKELVVPPWASVDDVEQMNLTMARLKCDLLCELISVHIMRSEIPFAEKHLAALTAHARTKGLFDALAARIMLHHAHLAHTKGDMQLAGDSYRAAAYLAEDGPARDDYVRTSARAGEVALRVGVWARGEQAEDSWEAITEDGLSVIDDCQRQGGTLRSVGTLIEACLSSEILKAKNLLRSAMSSTTDSKDNHLRALTLALLTPHFMHTAMEHAMTMLVTCEQLASGMGAGTVKGAKNTTGADTVGNGPLRLWIAERNLEIHRRRGDMARAEKQEAAIEALRKVVH